MDVSIAVSLIRGQMGTVVERAVNVAVETVLAEMLKVVGVKFEELKAQVAVMKRDVVTLQREKVLKEKENDNIRAKLRYTELKLKYYRQGVEEELQQRASASTLLRVHQSTFPQAQTDVSSPEDSPSCSSQTWAAEGQQARSNQECPSPKSRRDHAVCSQSDVPVASSDPSDLLLPVSLSDSTPAESLDSSTGLFCPRELDVGLSKDAEQHEEDCEWTLTSQPHTESTATVKAPAPPPPPPVHVPELDLSSDAPTQADSSTLSSSTPQVKNELLQEQQEEEEEEEEVEEEQQQQVICIKEEPEEEQEVMATLLLDAQGKQCHLPEVEAQMSLAEWSGLQMSQRMCSTGFSSAGQSSYIMPQPGASGPSGIPLHQVVYPWTKELSLEEEYNTRRNELRRRNLKRRRELEKTLPQPMLADLVRERREKTRLRVARWRAKRKLQYQIQAQGGAVSCQTGFPISGQQVKVTCASSSPGVNSISAPLPFSTPSSLLLLRGSSMAARISQNTVTSSSAAYPHVSLSQQRISLTDTDILQ